MEMMFNIADNQTGITYDARELLQGYSWTGQISDQPGKLTFDVIRDGTLKFYEGSNVILKQDGFSFFGNIFEKSRTTRHETSVVAYDQMRYLKNEGTEVFSEGTLSDRFSFLCSKWEIPKYRVVHPCSHVLAEEPFDKKTMMEMIQSGIDRTLIDAGVWYMVRDNFGTLELVDIAKLRTDLVIGDASLMTGYDYKTSIDSDTFNRVLIYKDNKESGKRDIHIVQNAETEALWGRLQHTESVSEEMTLAQIEQRAELLLKAKNRVSRTLSLSCLGDWRVMPGVGIWVETQLDDMNLSRYMMVHQVTHNVKNKEHTMQVNLEVVE